MELVQIYLKFIINLQLLSISDLCALFLFFPQIFPDPGETNECGSTALVFTYQQCSGSSFFPDPDQNFFSESGSGLAKNPDPIRKNPDQ